jgi:TPR repeat protein
MKKLLAIIAAVVLATTSATAFASESIHQIEKAATQGVPSAEYDLGLAYDKGYGVPKDATKSIYWINKSSKQGYAPAEAVMGGCYFFGKDVPQNRPLGRLLLQKAKSQGSATAALVLAWIKLIPTDTKMLSVPRCFKWVAGSGAYRARGRPC